MSAIPGAGWSTGVFQMHKKKTLAIPMEVHKINREKLCDILRSRSQSGVVVLQGGTEQNQYDTDTELLFRLYSLMLINIFF